MLLNLNLVVFLSLRHYTEALVAARLSSMFVGPEEACAEVLASAARLDPEGAGAEAGLTALLVSIVNWTVGMHAQPALVIGRQLLTTISECTSTGCVYRMTLHCTGALSR